MSYLTKVGNMFDFLRKLRWKKLKEYEIPKWVLKADKSFYESFNNRTGHRPYDIVTYFKGRSFTYKVWYECTGQGQITRHYYRKKR
jgi:hypothetical protein